MTQYFSLPVVALAVLFVTKGALAPGAARAFGTNLHPSLAAHWPRCHAPPLKNAGLRLDDLKPAFADPRTAAVCTKAHDKMVAGLMPPRTRGRPPQIELDN